MIDLQSPKIQDLIRAIGPVEMESRAFGEQMTAASAAIGIHIARTIRSLNARDAGAAIEEAAEILRRQVVATACGQYALDGLDTGRPS